MRRALLCFGQIVCLFSLVVLGVAKSCVMAQPTHVKFPSGNTLPITHGATGEGEEHFDPLTTGNPLLEVSGANGSKQLSKNFKAGEFAKSGTKTFAKARIDPELVKCLQAIRDHVDRPVVITSGYRSDAYNRAIYQRMGKKPTLSRHISGQAADIKIAGMSGLDIAKAALEAYGPDIGVGIGSTYAHIDVRGKYARWTYVSEAKNDETIQAIDAFRAALKSAREPHRPSGPVSPCSGSTPSGNGLEPTYSVALEVASSTSGGGGGHGRFNHSPPRLSHSALVRSSR